jgi:hypothetical protein
VGEAGETQLSSEMKSAMNEITCSHNTEKQNDFNISVEKHGKTWKQGKTTD